MIGIDGHVLGDRSGGNETYYRNLIEHFSGDQCKNIILFVSKNCDVSKLNFSGKIVRFKSSNAFVRNYIELPWLSLKYKLKVLHLQYFVPFIRFCPVVTTIHDISFEHFDNIFTKKDYFLQKHLIPYAAKKSKTIFTVSEYSKKDIIEHYRVPEENVVVTYNGISSYFKKLDNTEDDKMDLLEKYDVPEKYILCVGNLQPRKNIKRLLQAYIKFKKETNADIPLVIVGKKAWMFEGIFEDVVNNGLEKQVILTDYVSDKDLVKIYNQATIFVYPSIFEGFGLPVAEAMACGVPVVTSNVTSIPEVAGDACLLFDPYDVDSISESIVKMYFDEELRKNCIEKGFNQVKNFNWDNTSQITYFNY